MNERAVFPAAYGLESIELLAGADTTKKSVKLVRSISSQSPDGRPKIILGTAIPYGLFSPSFHL